MRFNRLRSNHHPWQNAERGWQDHPENDHYHSSAGSQRYFSEESTDYLREIKQRISTDFYEPNIHPQQRAILSLGYAAALHRIEMLYRMLSQTYITFPEVLNFGKPGQNDLEPNPFDEITINKEILLQIPLLVEPTHPVLSRVQILTQYFLNITESHPDIIDYYLEIVKNHTSELAIQWVLSPLIREQAPNYETVEQMEVYQIIVERFGYGELTRRSHEVFRMSRYPGQ